MSLIKWFRKEKVNPVTQEKIKLEPKVVLTEEQRAALFEEAVKEVALKRVTNLLINELRILGSSNPEQMAIAADIERTYGYTLSKIYSSTEVSSMAVMYPDAEFIPASQSIYDDRDYLPDGYILAARNCRVTIDDMATNLAKQLLDD